MKSFLIGIFIVIGAIFFTACATKNVSNLKDITTGYYHGEVVVKENIQRAWDNQDKKLLSLEEF